ncbi:hypothetical protein M408DRAFT_24184 [Serendipita vermifera MAFF 305830]|uniref:F-box domain-containing protein n=1 Tax=Serendipita vermifera MAFF 305830 TaxID=933852 RepID=A0A0C2XF89_SERVB|nr:hypothetical protein M408DRAFT_24184 [Serendipita vermifera MAFF 305830]
MRIKYTIFVFKLVSIVYDQHERDKNLNSAMFRYFRKISKPGNHSTSTILSQNPGPSVTPSTLLSEDADETLRKVPFQTIDTSLKPESHFQVPFKPGLAHKLPFDVLAQIFENYLLEETAMHPIETLLLVCRSWLQAALDVTCLWSTFRIVDDPSFWASCIPRRLARSPKDALLNVHIQVIHMGRPHSQQILDENRRNDTAYLSILCSLTGLHGEVARRWRIFTFIDPYNESKSWQELGSYLSFSTPHLERLHLQGITLPCGIFPETPILKTLVARNIKVLTFPDLGAAKSVRIDSSRNISAALANATLLTTLSVELPRSENLQGTYYCLHTLALSDRGGCGILNSFSTPSLRSLTLQAMMSHTLRVVMSCEGIPISRIECLDIAFGHLFGLPQSYAENFRDLLNAAASIKTLKLRRSVAPVLGLKLLANECQSLGQGQDFNLHLGEKEYTLKAGEDRVFLEILERSTNKTFNFKSSTTTNQNPGPCTTLPTILSEYMDETLLKEPPQMIRVPLQSQKSHTPFKSGSANKLPFDILAEIFKKYLLGETPEHPVEILLLVCKSWSQAALDTTCLWSTFRIYSNLGFWASCIPHRLARGRQDAFLDIRIRVGGSSTMQQKMDEGQGKETEDFNVLYTAYKSILCSLTGSQGEVAHRWRLFSLENHYESSSGWKEPSDLGKHLSFPTPHLTALYLQGITLPCGIIPESPVLNTFVALNVKVSAFPDLSAATFVHIHSCKNFNSALVDATQLMTLSIELSSPDKLKALYPSLHTLELSGCTESDAFDGFSAPSLRSLTIHILLPHTLWAITSCNGLPINRIEYLELSFGYLMFNPISYTDDLRRFLSAATNLRILKLWGTLASALALKLLTNECQSLGQGRDLNLHLGPNEYTLKAGEDRSIFTEKQLKKISDELCGSWEQAFKFLDNYLDES